MSQVLTDDALATVMITTHLALPRTGELEPLKPSEWATLVRALVAIGATPQRVLGQPAGDLQQDLGIEESMAERVVALLDRAGLAAIQLQRLADLGIWCITKLDEDYPTRLRQRLPAQSPPVLFGAGSRNLFTVEGVAIVGSRDADESSLQFAERLGQRCAAANLSVVSGAARGVDRTAMTAGLEAGGTAIGMVADGLERLIKSSDVRRYILDQQLVLASATLPDARFLAWRSMERNKYIYCMSSYAVVVASGVSGGTWEGARENLRHDWVPLFIRTEPGSPEGNRELLHQRVAKGGRRPVAMTAVPEEIDLGDWLESNAAQPQQEIIWPDAGEDESEILPKDSADMPTDEVEMGRSIRVETEPASTIRPAGVDIFEIVWPHLAQLLGEPRSESQLLALCRGVEKVQLRTWLKNALERGLITKRARPLRYLIADPRTSLADLDLPLGANPSSFGNQLTLDTDD